MKLRVALFALTFIGAAVGAEGSALADTPGPFGPRLAPIIHRGASLPPPNRSKPAPLVIALHGSSMSPAMMEQTTRFDSLADRRGFVVAYLGSQTPTSSAWTRYDMQTNLAYISQEIRSLTASENIDPSRVYVTGFSAGATMAFYVGCNLSSQVTAIAPVSGWMHNGQPCKLAKPESMLLIVGTNDAAPITGTPRLMSATGMASTWRGLDGCAATTSSAPVGTVQESRWGLCNDSSSVNLDVIGGGRHVWPSSGGGPDGQISATGVIWSFFSAHRAGSPKKVTATVRSIRALNRGHHRWVRIVLWTGESSVSGSFTVRGNGRRAASRSASLREGVATLSVNLPTHAQTGRYSIRIVLHDAYGRTTTIVRTVRIT